MVKWVNGLVKRVLAGLAGRVRLTRDLSSRVRVEQSNPYIKRVVSVSGMSNPFRVLTRHELDTTRAFCHP